jgi:CelD/BcsL family acetyltransferase involved in cellulose biosynthesis
MMFTTKGNTAGLILMEWNAHEESPGSAIMMDTIFRVGGANGTNLDLGNCNWKRSWVPNDRYVSLCRLANRG